MLSVGRNWIWKFRKKAKRPPTAKPDLAVEEALCAWRLVEARRIGVPPFRIFTERAWSGRASL